MIVPINIAIWSMNSCEVSDFQTQPHIIYPFSSRSNLFVTAFPDQTITLLIVNILMNILVNWWLVPPLLLVIYLLYYRGIIQ